MQMSLIIYKYSKNLYIKKSIFPIAKNKKGVCVCVCENNIYTREQKKKTWKRIRNVYDIRVTK